MDSTAGTRTRAFFNTGVLMDGKVACPACHESTLHPAGHAMPLDSQRVRPRHQLTAWCECGVGVAIQLGNYKGHFGIDVVAFTPMDLG